MVMINCDILFTDVVADADADNESADANFSVAHAHTTTHVRAHPRPWDVLMPFLFIQFFYSY